MGGRAAPGRVPLSLAVAIAVAGLAAAGLSAAPSFPAAPLQLSPNFPARTTRSCALQPSQQRRPSCSQASGPVAQPHVCREPLRRRGVDARLAGRRASTAAIRSSTRPRTGCRPCSSGRTTSAARRDRLLRESLARAHRSAAQGTDDDRGQRRREEPPAEGHRVVELRRSRRQAALRHHPGVHARTRCSSSRSRSRTAGTAAGSDSADHKQHMKYAARGLCPASHSRRAPAADPHRALSAGAARLAGGIRPLRRACGLHERLGSGRARAPGRRAGLPAPIGS